MFNKPLLTYSLLRQKLKKVWLKALPVTSLTAQAPLRRYGTLFYLDIPSAASDPSAQSLKLKEIPNGNLATTLNNLALAANQLQSTSTVNLNYLEQRLSNLQQTTKTLLVQQVRAQATVRLGVRLIVTVV
jgi:TolA-binding protein